ncbi:MAG TPA: prepilin-type N-terminal cleavage/methylation domain-containing protein [Bacilli bacterium]|nr:prepilin-type N-terminal cleavage/methylation domain-containing protein [Bacilli bacterium]
MKKNGFTLIEILAVLVIIGLLLDLTIPNVLKLGNKTKEKAYETKISMIENAAITYGENSKSSLVKSTTVCTPVVDANGEITSMNVGTSSATTLANGTYKCLRVTVDDLVDANTLSWDYKDQVTNSTDATILKYYNNRIIDPTNNYIINRCYVYVYYKYSRVYAYFDRNTCDLAKETYSDGNEYSPNY